MSLGELLAGNRPTLVRVAADLLRLSGAGGAYAAVMEDLMAASCPIGAIGVLALLLGLPEVDSRHVWAYLVPCEATRTPLVTLSQAAVEAFLTGSALPADGVQLSTLEDYVAWLEMRARCAGAVR